MARPMQSHDNDNRSRGDTDGADSTLTPRSGEGAHSALEALRRQQARKPATVTPAPQQPPRRGAREVPPPLPAATPKPPLSEP